MNDPGTKDMAVIAASVPIAGQMPKNLMSARAGSQLHTAQEHTESFKDY